MRKIINIIIAISIAVIILGITIIIFPTIFNEVNTHLSNLSNFFTYLGMMFAAFALLIACFAYKSAIMRPNLKLFIYPYLSLTEGPALVLNKKTLIVSKCRALTEWNFVLENTGDASAKYPFVQIDFKWSYFKEDDFPGWKAIDLVSALGWFSFQWSPENNVVIHPKLKMQLPTMYFNEKIIDSLPLDIYITIVADGFRKKYYKVPVKIEFEEFE